MNYFDFIFYLVYRLHYKGNKFEEHSKYQFIQTIWLITVFLTITLLAVVKLTTNRWKYVAYSSIPIFIVILVIIFCYFSYSNRYLRIYHHYSLFPKSIRKVVYVWVLLLSGILYFIICIIVKAAYS